MGSSAVLFGLLSGLFFGLTSHIQKRALADTQVSFGALISVGTMALLLWLGAPFIIETKWFFTQAALIFAICGLVFPAASQLLQVASVVQVGPALTSALGSLTPLFAVVIAVAFLGERLNLQGALGIVLMLIGVLLSTLGPGAGMKRSFALVALLLPLGAAAARGIVQPATKYGFAQIDSAYFASLVMATVATGVLAIWTLGTRTQQPIRQSIRGNLLFALNGAAIGTGILTLQLSISLGSVTLAAPLSATTPLWTLLLGLVFFRNEVLTWRHLAMSLLMVVGVVLVVTR